MSNDNHHPTSWLFLATFWRLRQRLGKLVSEKISAEFGCDLRAYIVVKFVQNGVLFPGDLAEAMQIPAYMASRLIEPLVERGLIERRFDPQDARRTRLGLTETGLTFVAAADRLIEAELDVYLARLSPERRAMLVDLLVELAGQGIPETE
ncbi:MAG: MarR family transcriptional regulator [Roseiflexaceae bacterium]